MENPFRYGTTVTGESFAGRDEELASLLNVIQLGENAVLHSPRGMGKSSTLRELARRNSGNFVFAHVELGGVSDETALIEGLIRESMSAGFGRVEKFDSNAWSLLANPRLREIVLKDANASLRIWPSTFSTPEPSSRKPNSGAARDRLYKGEMRLCSTCGKPLKWIEKYSMHYCYICRKYTQPKRRMKLRSRQPGSFPSDETRCPRCSEPLRYSHSYSEFYCEKCERYPMMRLSRSPRDRPTEADMAEALDLPERIADKIGSRLVVTFDDFHEAKVFENPMTLPLMRKRFEMQGNVSYLFAGSDRQVLHGMFEDSHGPFHGFAHWIDLKPMPGRVLEDFLVSKYRSSKSKLPSEVASAIVDLSGGYPSHAQKIAHELFHISSNPQMRSLENALATVVKQQSSTYKVIWDSIKSPLHRRYLVAVSNEPKVPHGDDFVQRHNLKSRSHIQRIEKQLHARRIVHGGEVVDPMFRLWLRASSTGFPGRELT